MLSWWEQAILQVGAFIVDRFGLPYLEKQFPKLVPLLDEILAILKSKGQALPSDALKDCSNGYCSTLNIPDLKK